MKLYIDYIICLHTYNNTNGIKIVHELICADPRVMERELQSLRLRNAADEWNKFANLSRVGFIFIDKSIITLALAIVSLYWTGVGSWNLTPWNQSIPPCIIQS